MSFQHGQMRGSNMLLVLEYIRQHGQCTRREIQRATGLSWAAISTIAADLIDHKMLCELPPSTRQAGRNPGLLDFLPMRNLTIGVELNAEGLSVFLFDLRCTVLDSVSEPLHTMERDEVLEQMLSAMDSMISKNSLTPECLLGIGIAMQGSVNREGTTSLYNSFFLNWRDVPVREICEEHFGVPTFVMHDPVCIALAEQWSRKYSAEDDFALIRLSYGIGMCYIVGGHPIIGTEGSAGELGHIVVNTEGPRCSCGNRGCLECYSSIRGLSHRITEAAKRAELALPESLMNIDDRDVVGMKACVDFAAEEAAKGNQTAKQLFEELSSFLGVGLANIVSLFNPKYLILTGELMEYSGLFLEKAQKISREASWKFADYEIILSKGGRKSAAMGAALHFINDAFANLSSKLLATDAAT